MSNKMSLEWHKQCLKNSAHSLSQLRDAASRAIDELKRADDKYLFYAQQIIAAESQGKDGFDAEKYMVPRRKP